MNSFLGICLILIGTSQAQVITSIETKTMDVEDGGMTFGKIDVEVFNTDALTCKARELDGDGNDFKPGDINVFTGSEIGDCDRFLCPNHTVTLVRVHHSGLDAWACEWIRIVFDDNSYVQCADGQMIDNSQIHNLSCGAKQSLSDLDDDGNKKE